uniref:Cadherin domain-containing protein n=1 Tax=Hucho hucho TaxID=62062 RepID=A0A4W5LFN4_9TELE
MEGNGLTSFGKAIITVTDSNDNAPQFVTPSYTVSIPENKVDALVVKMPVTDGDEPHSSAWATTYKIVDGDPQGLFNVCTGPSKLEGIITTVKVC